LNLAQLGTTHLGIRANMPDGYQQSVLIRIDAGAPTTEDASSGFTLGMSGANLTAGAHTITANAAIMSDTATTVGTQLMLNVNVIAEAAIPPSHDANAPQVTIKAMQTTVAEGHAIHVNGLSSVLKSGTVLTAKYE